LCTDRGGKTKSKRGQRLDRVGAKAKRAGGEKVLETAVFLDSAAYSRFAAYYKKIGEFVVINI